MPGNTWFITGCSTGLGRALAEAVLGHRQRAVVTARDPGQVADLVAGHTVDAEEPPLRLLLGKAAYDIATARLGTLQSTFDTWREVTLGADFPEGLSMTMSSRGGCLSRVVGGELAAVTQQCPQDIDESSGQG